VNEHARRNDDHLPATRGELRALAWRVSKLEELRKQVSDLEAEFEGFGAAAERHIKQAMSAAVTDALKPYVDGLSKLEMVRRILLEQEFRAELAAEAKANEEVARAERAATREHRLKRLAIFGPIIVALITAGSATLISQCSAVRAPTTVTK